MLQSMSAASSFERTEHLCCIASPVFGISVSSQTHPNVRQRVKTRRVASVNSDGLSESSSHQLAVVASRDAVARLGGCLHLMRDGVGGSVYTPLEGNQGLSVEDYVYVLAGGLDWIGLGWKRVRCGCRG